jgi:hypothetical protein
MLKQSQLFSLSAILLFGLSVNAQNNSVTTGGDATGPNGTVSYTIGQIDYTSNQGSNGSVHQGVQQAFEIYTVGLSENEIQISLSVFPNPVQENLTLQITGSNQELSYELIDVNGKIHLTRKNLIDNTNIDLSTYSKGIYFLKVRSKSNTIKTFKIIKK